MLGKDPKDISVNVDKVAAHQGVIDAKEKQGVDPELCDRISSLMHEFSAPGQYRRKEFDLATFLRHLSEIAFDEYSPLEVAVALKLLGESLSSGISTASPD
jgi:hypothetical protein